MSTPPMSTPTREILRLMADGWSLHVRPGASPLAFPRRHARPLAALRRDGQRRPALTGAVKRLLTLGLVEETGRDGEDVTYSLNDAGRHAALAADTAGHAP